MKSKTKHPPAPSAKMQRQARGKPRSSSAASPMARVAIPRRLKDTVERAAAILGRSDDDFLIAALSEAANKVIAEDSVIRLCLEDQKALAAAILDDKPHPPSRKLSRLKRAIREHSESVESV